MKHPVLRCLVVLALAASFGGVAIAQAPAAAPAAAPASAAASAPIAPAPALQFALIKTGSTDAREGLTYAGGSFTRSFPLNYIAVLVRHPSGSLLFDTGLGKEVDQQNAVDSIWWARALSSYNKGKPARTQLEEARETMPARIFLSHAHWDHASGIVDFPEAQVWISAAERAYVRSAKPPAVWPSQVASLNIQWKEFQFDRRPVLGFEQTLDLFGDGSAVLLSMPGHTPGSAGLLLTVGSGKRYLFVGDTVWNADAIAAEAPKSWIGRKLADSDADRTLMLVKQLHALAAAEPALVIVPAHDARVHDKLGYFPNWVK
jgi:glyoxylase-like metal-dependent hydrolase (beta-lactamase superfamily II)